MKCFVNILLTGTLFEPRDPAARSRTTVVSRRHQTAAPAQRKPYLGSAPQVSVPENCLFCQPKCDYAAKDISLLVVQAFADYD